jgi:hypothetical protein
MASTSRLLGSTVGKSLHGQLTYLMCWMCFAGMRPTTLHISLSLWVEM